MGRCRQERDPRRRAFFASWDAITSTKSFFVLVATFVAVGYSVLLPFAFTQRISWRNWHYLDSRFIAFSVGFGLTMGWLVMTQTYAVHRVLRQRGGALGGAGAFVGLLPSLVCCTPIVPTVLGFIGLSGTSLAHTSGRTQYFFATRQNLILGASLGVTVLAGIWATRRLVRAACLTDDRCALVDVDVDASPTRQPVDCCAGEARSTSKETAGTHG